MNHVWIETLTSASASSACGATRSVDVDPDPATSPLPLPGPGPLLPLPMVSMWSQPAASDPSSGPNIQWNRPKPRHHSTTDATPVQRACATRAGFACKKQCRNKVVTTSATALWAAVPCLSGSVIPPMNISMAGLLQSEYPTVLTSAQQQTVA